MEQLTILDHPLIQNKMSMLRNIETGNKEFRELVAEVAMLVCYEAARNIALSDVEIETPVCKTSVKMMSDKVAIVPILRAGLGMAEGVLRLLPNAKVGHIGVYRDPDTLLPVEYYCKLPKDINEHEVFLLDCMLATGGTAAASIGFLKERFEQKGGSDKKIKLLCLIASPQGVKKVISEHPDVQIYTAAYDSGLNEHGYIVPGLGDAGDRIYGTK